MISYLWKAMGWLSPRMGGDEGGGASGPSAADLQKQEEEKKAGLRAKLNRFFGVADPTTGRGAAPTREQFMSAPTTQRSVIDEGGNTIETTTPGTVDEAAYAKALADWQNFNGADPEAQAAADTIAKNRAGIVSGVEDYQNAELKRIRDRAERQRVFGLARSGNLGGSADVDSSREMSLDNATAATRIAEAARQAGLNYDNATEQARQQGENLILSGAGENAINSAKTGLDLAFRNASNASKAGSFGDLFQVAAQGAAAGNDLSRMQLIAALTDQRAKSIFNGSNPGSGSTGRVTAT